MNLRKDYNIKIGMRLREIRENLGISQERFAEAMGLSVSHYRKLETGVYSLTIERILILNHIYHVDPTYLIIGIQEESDLLKLIANCSKFESRDRLCKVLEFGIGMLREGKA